MNIVFHNRQRREPVNSKNLSAEFARLLNFLGADLMAEPPRWLKKKQLKQIFGRGSLSVALVSNKAIRAVNKDWREQDKATDVLSFPLELTPPPFIGLVGADAFDEGEEDDEDYEWIVGEILISMERAREQAEEYGHSLDRELSFLFVHGVLHVLGFDHVTKEEEKEMFGRQRRILDAAGVRRTK
ncbi:MAG: rRNA maturation RNase YbeY [Cyanobacteria bacterium REEB67]|nr:rRNA maturation RNase YbeY [Cyanobacteria bacterium REEB67]